MKYTNIKVLSGGYVSSAFDYFIEDVRYQENGCQYTESYCITRQQFMGVGSKPKYFILEVKRQIALLFETNSIVWHEYDGSGNKRFDNLKYFDETTLQEIAKDYNI